MRYILYLILIFCNIYATSDSTHTIRASHHLNSRSATKSNLYDWYVNIQTSYAYNKYINPKFILDASTERDNGSRYNGYLVSHLTDYYFIRDRVDEEHDLYLFETGLHYTLFYIKHGYSYLWWDNTKTERHAIYHRYENDWLVAEIQYMNIIYKVETELFIEHNWTINSDNIFFKLSGKYIKNYHIPQIWSLGYTIGYEW